MNAPAYSLFSSYFHSSSSRPAKYGTKRFLGGTILLLSLLVLGSWASAQTTPGARGRPLTFSDNAANSLPTVSLAETLSSPVSVSPARLTFASGAVGTKSGAQTVTLTNHLNTSLPVSPAVATGDFVVASNTCGSSVGPGRSCTVEVTFRPTVVGVRTGTLTLPYRASGSPIVIPLSGAGNANGLISLVVTPANPSIAAGSTQQFTATGTYSNGSTQNLTASVAWSSSAPGVATINAAGLASSVSPGSTTITATWVTITPLGRATGVTPGSPIINPPRSTISGSTTLTVTDPLLVSMAVTPANPSIAAGTTQQFTATGTYSDGSTQNLTSTAAWSSSAPGVATISNTSGSQGVASAVGPRANNDCGGLGRDQRLDDLDRHRGLCFDRQPEHRALLSHGDAAEQRHGADGGRRWLQRLLSQCGAVQSRHRDLHPHRQPEHRALRAHGDAAEQRHGADRGRL